MKFEYYKIDEPEEVGVIECENYLDSWFEVMKLEDVKDLITLSLEYEIKPKIEE